MSVPETHLTILREGAPPEFRTILPGAYVIGRGSEADIRIETPLLSRTHARLTVKERDCIVEDLGSSNGTFINGERISAVTLLRPEEKLQLGPVTVEISRLPGPPTPAVSLTTRRESLRQVLPSEFLRENRYETGNMIAQGGMGAIYSSREFTVDRTVAMKVMLRSDSSEDVLRFISEAKVTGQLEHPNIVPVHELGVDDQERIFYTMKYVRGITLREVLDQLFDQKTDALLKYPLGQLLTIFQKVCDAVAFAHSKGVIHRDLKPENFMLGDYGEVLVMEWGLAKVLDPMRNAAASFEGHSIIRTGLRQELHAAEAQSGNVMGTPQYMAPEQAYGQHDALDIRTDIYALGAILHHLLTLRPPIDDGDPKEILHKAARGEFQPARTATLGKARLPHLPGGKVPEALSAVAQKAMAQQADDRYQRVPDLQDDIKAYQAGFATTAENAGFGKQALLLVKRQRYLAIGLAVSLLLFTGIVAYLLQDQSADRRAADETAALIAQLRAAHPNGKGFTKADYEALATLAEKQHRPEAALYRDLAAQAGK